MELILGPIVSVGLLYLDGALCHWVGTFWWDGRASPVQVRAALAWNLHLVFPILFVAWLVAEVVPVLAPVVGGLYVLAIWVWFTGVGSHMLAEILGFSAWKGLATAVTSHLLSTLVLTALVWVLGVVSIPAMSLIELAKLKRVPNEELTLTVLGNVQSGLEKFKQFWRGYPDSLRDLDRVGYGYDFGGRGQLYGYLYRYQPTPESCADGDCSAFTLTAVPKRHGKTVHRSFFLDQSGVIRHCTGAADATTADPPVDQPPGPCTER